MRPSFLDDVPAAEARRCAGRGSRSGASTGARTARRACVIGHEMSRHYVLEYPVDDPDEDQDDDVDEDGGDGEDDDDDEEEDGDDEEVETWQVQHETFR